MPDILAMAKGMRKKEFLNKLDVCIANSIKIDRDYRDLSYEKDYAAISRILLLFNIQSIIDSESSLRFPFSKYNTSEWSLEHIHAQQSEGMRTQEVWREWLALHIPSVNISVHNQE